MAHLRVQHQYHGLVIKTGFIINNIRIYTNFSNKYIHEYPFDCISSVDMVGIAL